MEFSRQPGREDPDGNPGDSNGKRGSFGTERRNEQEIQYGVYNQSDNEYPQAFLHFSHSRENLEVNLKKKIENDKRGRVEEYFA